MVWLYSWQLPQLAWVKVLRHACEGAFIGGICDWYAILKVYRKIEEHHETLAAEVSETVIDDMIRPEEAVAELRARLTDPAFAREVVARVQTLVPDTGAVRTFLEDAWRDSLRERVLGWLVELDPREGLRTAGGGPLGDEAIRSGVHHCLAHAVARPELAGRLYGALIARFGDKVVLDPPLLKPWTFEAVFRRLLTADDMKQRMVAAVDRALGPEQGPEHAAAGQLAQVGRDYLVAYVDGWHAMSPDQRRDAAGALLDSITPHLFATLSEAVWEQREHLGELVAQDLPLDAHPLVDFLEERVGQLYQEQLEQLDVRSQRLLTDKLTSMGPAELREMLERRTRRELDWIQVNGAVLGLVLGATVGAASLVL